MSTDTTAVEAAEPKTIPELRKYEGTLYVKNNTPKFYAIRHRVGQDRIDVELQPVGEPDSIAILPKLALELRGFQRSWMRKELTVSTDPEIENEITLLMNKHVNASEAQLAEMMATTTPSNAARALVHKPCLQCGHYNREGVIEGGQVTQSAKEAKEGVPPLCDDHVDLGHLFSRTQGEDEEGNIVWTFKPIVTK